MGRVYNFSAGPAAIPVEVMEQAQREMLDWNGSGMSVMEMSHRGKEYLSIAEKAEADLRALLAVPANYKVLFLQGGASQQFAMVPMNLLAGKKSADYVNTGAWSKKAISEAKKFCTPKIAATTEADKFMRAPAAPELKLDADAAYVHYTPNETIGGVEFPYVPATGDVERALLRALQDAVVVVALAPDLGRHAVEALRAVRARELPVGDRARDTPVAVVERVDGHEPKMREPRPDHCVRTVVPVRPAQEARHLARQQRRCRRLVVHLLLADRAGHRLHQPARIITPRTHDDLAHPAAPGREQGGVPPEEALIGERLGEPLRGIEHHLDHALDFDVQAVCSDFVYAMSVANNIIKAGQAKHALVIGAETLSRITDWNDRGNCILWGDGAGAVVLQASAEPGIISTHIHADGCYQDLIFVDGGVSLKTEGACHMRMSGNVVFKMAVKTLDAIVDETLEANGLAKADIHWLVPHQANIRIIQATAKKLGMGMDNGVVTVDRHGNTSAASIPLAFDTAVSHLIVVRSLTPQ